MKDRICRILLYQSWYIEDIHLGVASYARAAGWHLEANTPCSQINVHTWKGDGIICGLGLDSKKDDALASSGLPIVELSLSRQDLPFYRVDTDHRRAGELAAEYLLDLGFDNLYACYFMDVWHSRLRFEGFRKKLKSVSVDSELIHVDLYPEVEKAKKSILKHLKRIKKPAGIFCTFDVWGALVVQLCVENNIRVPEDIAVLGAGNEILECRNSAIPLSSVDTGDFERGYKAAAALDKLMKGQILAERYELIKPVSVVERLSTVRTVHDDETVGKAVEFIMRNMSDPFSADELARHCSVSKRTLERKFRKAFHTTVGKYTALRKIDAVKEKLKAGNAKISDIAESCGFGTANYLDRVFKNICGMSPSRFRKIYGLRRSTETIRNYGKVH